MKRKNVAYLTALLVILTALLAITSALMFSGSVNLEKYTSISTSESTIIIQKFIDRNHNGLVDLDDERLPGGVFIIRDPKGKATTYVTDVTGEIRIEVPEGKYIIVEQLRHGWTSTTPTTVVVNVQEGRTTVVEFLNAALGIPTPTPAPTPTFPELIAQKLEEPFFSGLIVFNPPKRMQVGREERVEVRITKNTTKEMRDVLRKGLKGKGDPRIEEIEVGDFMTVNLSGNNFVIKSSSSEEQMLRPDKFTQWSWDVTPQKKGKQVLKLVATIRIKFPDHSEEPYDLEAFEEYIIVDVNYAYSVKRFIESQWKWIVGTVIAIVTLIATNAIRKKRGE